MIRAIYRDGAIRPLDEVPSTWLDGRELIVAECVGNELHETIEQWAAEMDAAATLEDEDHDRFMKALEEVERESKVLGRRETEKSARIFNDDLGPSCETA